MALAPRQGRHAPAAPSRLEDSPALADICSEGWVGRCVAYSGRRRGRRSGLHCKLLLASASLLLSSNKGPAPIPCPRLFYPTPPPGYPLTHHSGCSNLQPSRAGGPSGHGAGAFRRALYIRRIKGGEELSRWLTGVLAGDGGEDGVEVALGEGPAGEQRLQQGVVPPRQRRHREVGLLAPAPRSGTGCC